MRFLNCPAISANLFNLTTAIRGAEFVDGDYDQFIIAFYHINGSVYRCQYNRGTTVSEVTMVTDQEAIDRLLAIAA